MFFRNFSATESKTPICSHCKSENLDRLISKVIFMAAWGESLNWPGSAVDDYDEDDPKSMARWMREMSKESGEGFGNEEMQGQMEDMIQRMEDGQMPHSGADGMPEFSGDN